MDAADVLVFEGAERRGGERRALKAQLLCSTQAEDLGQVETETAGLRDTWTCLCLSLCGSTSAGEKTAASIMLLLSQDEDESMKDAPSSVFISCSLTPGTCTRQQLSHLSSESRDRPRHVSLRSSCSGR